MENNYFDDLVRDAIGDYDATSPSSDWDEMEKHLDTSTALRQKLYIAKSIEIFLMAFAIWTVVQFVKTDNISTLPTSNVPQKMETPAQLPVSPFVYEEEQKGKQEQKIQPQFPVLPPKKVQEKQVKEAASNLIDMPVATIQAPVMKSVKAELLPRNSNNVIQNIQQNQSLINTNNLEVLPVVKTKKEEQNIDYNAIATLDYKLLENRNKNLSPLDVIPAAPDNAKGQKPKSKFRLSGLIAADWFRISTSEKVPVTKKQEKISGTVGLLADYQISKTLRVETGVAYSMRNQMEYDFEPSAYGTKRRVLDVQAKSIEVPVNLKYNFASVGETDFYMVAGVSNYFIMKVNNDLQEIDYYSGIMSNAFQDPRVSADSFNEGLAKNGELNSNHYASINGGIGAERSIGKGFTAFVQGDYKQGVFTSGRHEDTISAVSLSAGVRRSL